MAHDNEKSPLQVSVVIPAYNSGKYLDRALASVLAQTRPVDEIIVVDDGSTDNTRDLVQKYGDQVRYIYQDNAGVSAARNTGIKAAKYEWIAFLDADDEWLPEKTARQLEILERNPHLAWVSANFYDCLCQQNRKSPRTPPVRDQQILAGKDYHESFFNAYVHGAWGNTDTFIIKRQALEEAGLFDVGQVFAEDKDLWLRLAYRFPQIGYVSDPLTIYHLDVDASASRKQKFLHWQVDFIDRHLQFAAEHGCLRDFEPCATFMLRSWMRSMLFDRRTTEIRELQEHFGYLLPTRFKFTMKLLTLFPQATAKGCHLISRVVRSLRLRRRAVRPPDFS